MTVVATLGAPIRPDMILCLGRVWRSGWLFASVTWLRWMTGNGERDGPVAEVGYEVQASAEGLDVAGDDLEGGDFAVLDLEDPGDTDSHSSGEVPLSIAAPAFLRLA